MLLFEVRRFHLLKIFFEALEALFDLGEVGKHQLELEAFGVARGIDGTGVGNGVVLEGAEDVDEGVHIAEAGEEGGFFEGFLTDGGDVGVFDGGLNEFFGIEEGGETIEPIVGHFGDADVGFAGVAAVFDYGFGEDFKERGFADLREADDAGFHDDPKKDWAESASFR